MRSDIDILRWVCDRIKLTDYKELLSGGLYDCGRPDGSLSEDIVVSVLASEGCGQIQQAYVNVNIYVPDIWNMRRKEWKRDTQRCQLIARWCKFLFTMRGDGFRVSDKDSSQRILPMGVTYEDGHTEHFINNKLYIKISNE